MSTYNNGPGNVPRLPDRVVDTLIDTAGVSRCAPGRVLLSVVDQTEQVERLVHDACEELLARLPAAPIAAQLDAELPPLSQLPEPAFRDLMGDFPFKEAYTAEQVETIRRADVAPYAERIRLLERELAEVRSLAKQGMCHGLLADDYCGQIVAKIGPRVIDRENAQQYMEESLWAFIDCAGNYPGIKPNARVWPHVFAYIDGRTAGTAPKAPDPTEAAIEQRAKEIYAGFVFSSRYPWVAGGNSLRQDDARAQARAEFAAAPSPQENTK